MNLYQNTADGVTVDFNAKPYDKFSLKTGIVQIPVYALGEKCARGRHVISVTPALYPQGKDNSDWRDIKGKPKTIMIEFKDGVANVEATLADFITMPGLNVASKTRPILHA